MFEQCADALEAVDSNQTLLRVMFRVELAKLELESDFVDKVREVTREIFPFSLPSSLLFLPSSQASTHIDKAMRVDYTLSLDRLPPERQELLQKQPGMIPSFFLSLFCSNFHSLFFVSFSTISCFSLSVPVHVHSLHLSFHPYCCLLPDTSSFVAHYFFSMNVLVFVCLTA